MTNTTNENNMCSKMCSIYQTFHPPPDGIIELNKKNPSAPFEVNVRGSRMNEWCIYIGLYCVLLYTQSALTIVGGGLCSTTTSVQHPLGWCDGCHRTTAPVCSPHTSYRWRGERVQERQSSVCAHHTPATGGGRGESHRANQVYALTTHQLQMERRES